MPGMLAEMRRCFERVADPVDGGMRLAMAFAALMLLAFRHGPAVEGVLLCCSRRRRCGRRGAIAPDSVVIRRVESI